MDKKTRIGIIGCGWIAEKMAITLQGMENAQAYAIASRDIHKARNFAKQWNFTHAYGSYEEMLDDEGVDLVYIATPHSHHYDHTRLSLLKGKPVLCEKSFTANAKQAEALIQLAKEKNLFLTEAIWTRYMPLSQTIRELIDSGVIGQPILLTANLGYPNYDWERMHKPELAGGALLDLGVYTLNFAAMAFGTDIVKTTSTCIKSATGIDAQNSITLEYADGKMAVLNSSLLAKSDRQGIISGDKGFMIVENINNPQQVRVYDEDYRLKATYDCPPQITGYEYQVYASIEAMNNGWLESPYMPHAETLRIMQQMDALRKEWGIIYPFE
jgi:predicted dehydrogenase